jgi:pimeloyl-ACP methyl ester carboxylesterase
VRFTHRGGAALLAYIDASLAALEDRYPAYADTSTPLLAGFSLGASEILTLAVQAPARFPRIALVEGGTSGWTDARIEAYRAGGVCSTAPVNAGTRPRRRSRRRAWSRGASTHASSSRR